MAVSHHAVEMYLGQRLAWLGDLIAAAGDWLVAVGDGWTASAAARAGKLPRKLPEGGE